tara:strand:- start:145244 stop:145654 length:411 start_codon:yes stop_codon:yes gene_type:complete
MAILFTGCGSIKKDKIEEPMAIIYLAQSRGYYYSIKFTNTVMVVEKDALQEMVLTKRMEDKTWNEFCQIVSTIDLGEINDFKAPTDGSMTDRAAIASLTIDFSNKSYTSNTFDHGTPPKQLKPLIDKILALAETAQ